jgi:hypothetical protein
MSSSLQGRWAVVVAYQRGHVVVVVVVVVVAQVVQAVNLTNHG